MTQSRKSEVALRNIRIEELVRGKFLLRQNGRLRINVAHMGP
jgi:hypothetical protein